MKIPKIIHYCWFGGNPLPESALKCVESWKKFCPDYQIIEWNESNYDVTKNRYMKEAYECKRWGFVPDYARLDIIYNNGGIYLDTDVELLKPLDDLLDNEAFAGIEQDSNVVAIGLGFGAVKNCKTIKQLRDYYDNLTFIKNGEPDLTPAPRINGYVLSELGYVFSKNITKCGDLTIYPSEYFCPQNFNTGKLTITDNTYSIHHYDSSWFSDKEFYSLKLSKKLGKVLPKKFASQLAHFVAQCKFDGFFKAVKRSFKKIFRK